ncbi:MAG: hypothetical protein U0556_13040 [Dehalococcoidia bacterium]
MSWTDDPVLRFEAIGSFLSSDERASLLESENRALREKLSAVEEALGLLQMKLIDYETNGLARTRSDPAAWQAARAALGQRLQTLEDAQGTLIALFRHEHRQISSDVRREIAQALSAGWGENEQLVSGLLTDPAKGADDLRGRIEQARAQAALAQSRLRDSLEGRVRTVQDSIDNLLDLFLDETETLVRGVRQDFGGLPSAPYAPRLTIAPADQHDSGQVDPAVEPAAPPEAPGLGPALAAESRRNRGGLQQARLIISPFPNFAVLIRFDEALKRIGAIQRLRSRSFRAGRLEVSLEYDPNESLVDALLAQRDVPLALLTVKDDDLIFRVIGEEVGQSAPA